MSPEFLLTAETIGEEVVRRLELCTLAQGAETDLGVKVYRGRRHVDDSMIPCVALIEGKDDPNPRGTGTNAEIKQHYVMFAYVPCDPLQPNAAAHKALRDMKRAMFNTDGAASPSWGRRVKQVHYKGRDIGPRSDGAAYVVAAIEIAVEFVENLAQP